MTKPYPPINERARKSDRFCGRSARRLGGALTVGLALAALIAAPAAAATPPGSACDSVTGPSLSIEVGSQVAFGPEPVYAELDTGTITDSGPIPGTMTFSVENSATSQTISSEQVPAADYPRNLAPYPSLLATFTAAPTNPALLVVVTYQTTVETFGTSGAETAVTCDQSVSQPVNAVAGQTPTFKYHNEAEDFHVSTNEFAAAMVLNPPAGNCWLQSAGQLTAVLSGEHRRAVVDLTPCYDLGRFPTLPGLTFENETSSSAKGWEIGLFAPALNRAYNYRYSLTVRFGATVLFSGQVFSSRIWSPGERIYQGTDGFVNTCIDKHYTIYSANLRLYCFVPSSGFSTVAIRRSAS
jgi:hypothetical protein